MHDGANELRNKELRLHSTLQSLGCVAVAFSGGVDSSYLLATAVDTLGSDRVVALTADSPLLARVELDQARGIAASLGVLWRVLVSDDLADPQVAANDASRCYHCKFRRFSALIPIAAEYGAQLLHGENADDLRLHRPGSAAARELHIRAPLAETGLSKLEIRELARMRGLPNWNYPAASCLATRFPYGTHLTPQRLQRVEQAEAAMRELAGSSWPIDTPLRVRDHGDIARIETAGSAMPALMSDAVRCALVERLRALGYRYVTLDLAGYRMGSYDA